MVYYGQFEIRQCTTDGILRSIWNMTMCHWWYATVNLKCDNVPLMVYYGQFEIWQCTTDGILRSIWNMTMYHWWYTTVNLKYDNVPLMEHNAVNVLITKTSSDSSFRCFSSFFCLMPFHWRPYFPTNICTCVTEAIGLISPDIRPLIETSYSEHGRNGIWLV